MSTDTTVSRQWATRPDDERFTSLTALGAHQRYLRERSVARDISTKRFAVQPVPTDDMRSLQVIGPNGHPAAMTHYAFGQLASLAGAPGGYLRSLPAPLAADNLNYGLKVARDVEDVKVLLRKTGEMPVLAAATGPGYGRVWNQEITDGLIERFGDGTTGDWRVPGEFGKRVTVTKANTTLYASDRDMFVFLADEVNRVRVPDRRDGKSGSLARGFYVWNSEVGAASLGVAFFLFDYACCNRIIWGQKNKLEVRIRHSSKAPDRWLGEVEPVLAEYRESSAKTIEATVAAAKAKKIAGDLADFMSNRFSRGLVQKMAEQHQVEEGHPVETVWDAVTAATAYARNLPHQDARVMMEREAGKLLDLVTV